MSGDSLSTTSLTSENGEIERVSHSPVEDPHTQIAAGLEQLVILTRVTLAIRIRHGISGSQGRPAGPPDGCRSGFPITATFSTSKHVMSC